MTQAERIIDLFGGPVALGRALGRPYTTVQGWRRGGGFIPAKYHSEIIEAGTRLAIAVTEQHFIPRRARHDAGPAVAVPPGDPVGGARRAG